MFNSLTVDLPGGGIRLCGSATGAPVRGWGYLNWRKSDSDSQLNGNRGSRWHFDLSPAALAEAFKNLPISGSEFSLTLTARAGSSGPALSVFDRISLPESVKLRGSQGAEPPVPTTGVYIP